jgi:cytochrome P450
VVGLSICAMQRDPRWWSPDTDSYEPVRFCDNNVVAARPNLASMPFGAELHRCLGAAMGYPPAKYPLATGQSPVLV